MSTLKKPLFINGMYNREGKNCRADFVREVNNGAESYKLWTCTEKNQYPANERDRYFLYVEINNYLVPLRMTDYKFTDVLGFFPACVELYGTREERARVWRRTENTDALRAQEESAILRYGSDPARQADYIHKLLSDHVRYYIAARDNGGTFADFIGAAVLGELENCVELSAKLRAEREAKEEAARREQEAQEAREAAEREELHNKALKEVENVFTRGGLIKDGALLVEIADAHGVKIPLRTRGWILNSFAQCSIAIIDGAPRYSVRYYKRNSGTGSTKIYDIIRQVRAAIVAA
jgi:hypothetical protein